MDPIHFESVYKLFPSVITIQVAKIYLCCAGATFFDAVKFKMQRQYILKFYETAWDFYIFGI